ncbi:MAG: hypothetical protein IT230_02800 [Flavobacteriales bacterium]|nr:hypothetical protein [Flavobacteriales bacterium]
MNISGNRTNYRPNTSILFQAKYSGFGPVTLPGAGKGAVVVGVEGDAVPC